MFHKDASDEPTLPASGILKRGGIKFRIKRKEEQWDSIHMGITARELFFCDAKTNKVLEVVKLLQSFSIFETNVGANTFEIVTSRVIYHLMSESKEVMSSCMAVLREVIEKSPFDLEDTLLQQSLWRVQEDEYYTAHFRETKPLGVVMERSREWAVVKFAATAATGIQIGSILDSINGEPVSLQTYHYTVGQLRNWKPPLALGFRRPPTKAGFLIKGADFFDKKTGKLKGGFHKRRYFILESGRLMYKNDDSPDSEIRGDLPLMGSSVFLLPRAHNGEKEHESSEMSSPHHQKQRCSFRLISGVVGLTLSAEDHGTMMDWATALYHAISLANGGQHAIALERELAEARRRDGVPSASGLLSFVPNYTGNPSSSAPKVALDEGFDREGKNNENEKKAKIVSLGAVNVDSSSKARERQLNMEFGPSVTTALLQHSLNENMPTIVPITPESNPPPPKPINSEFTSSVGSAIVQLASSDLTDLGIGKGGYDITGTPASGKHSGKWEEPKQGDESSVSSGVEESSRSGLSRTASVAPEYLPSNSHPDDKSWISKGGKESTDHSRSDAGEGYGKVLSQPEFLPFEVNPDDKSWIKKENDTEEDGLSNLDESKRSSVHLPPTININLLYPVGSTTPSSSSQPSTPGAFSYASGPMDRAGEVETMLRKAVEQNFKAKLRLALNLATEMGFNDPVHSSHGLYLQAESLLSADQGQAFKVVMDDGDGSGVETSPFPSRAKIQSSSQQLVLDRHGDLVSPTSSCVSKTDHSSDIIGEIDDESNFNPSDSQNNYAGADELRRVFRMHVQDDDGTMKAVMLSGIYRHITGEKGNLFKEMQLFQMMDKNGNGWLTEQEFVSGWLSLRRDPSDESRDLLKKIKQLAAAGSIVVIDGQISTGS